MTDDTTANDFIEKAVAYVNSVDVFARDEAIAVGALLDLYDPPRMDRLRKAIEIVDHWVAEEDDEEADNEALKVKAILTALATALATTLANTR